MHEEQLSYGGTPRVGFGDAVMAPIAAIRPPWAIVLATSIVSATTGWVIEEVAQTFRKKKRRRR